MIMGAGGTGKSQLLHVITEVLSEMGVILVVTAYTGVAAAPFGGPTLMSLLNMSLNDRMKAQFLEQGGLKALLQLALSTRDENAFDRSEDSNFVDIGLKDKINLDIDDFDIRFNMMMM